MAKILSILKLKLKNKNHLTNSKYTIMMLLKKWMIKYINFDSFRI